MVVGITNGRDEKHRVEFYLDDEYAHLLYEYKWYAAFTKYGVIGCICRLKDGRQIPIHWDVIGEKGSKSRMVDHIDGNPTNNVKSNLRWVSNNQNTRNTKINRKNTSGFKGVSWYKPYKKYQAQIKINYKNIHLGYFDTPEEASRAYEKASELYHGEYRRIESR